MLLSFSFFFFLLLILCLDKDVAFFFISDQINSCVFYDAYVVMIIYRLSNSFSISEQLGSSHPTL